VERHLRGMGIPVIALLAEAHLETLHRLAQLPSGTRVGVIAAALETAHSLEHSIANAGLPNLTLVGACPPDEAGMRKLIRRADVVICSGPAAERVRKLAGPAVRVMVDERALDPRALETRATVQVRRMGEQAVPPPRLPNGSEVKDRRGDGGAR
jgi:hypothetical protein